MDSGGPSSRKSKVNLYDFKCPGLQAYFFPDSLSGAIANDLWLGVCSLVPFTSWRHESKMARELSKGAWNGQKYVFD